MQKDVIALEDTFAEIEESTLEHILHKQITISDFKAGLTNLSIEHREVHKDFFEKIYSEMDQALTVHSVWERLSTYWSFHNCTLFEEIVYKFGDAALKVSMEDYLEKLKRIPMQDSPQRFQQVLHQNRYYHVRRKLHRVDRPTASEL